jgi:rhodanese-related sulfurtransferase/CBS domain-containing protein
VPTPVHRIEVQRLLFEEQAQLVEVLPADGFEKEHLPGAINIPLKTLDAETTRQLDPERPVIVYCYDYQWDLSPRAAWRLESLGFRRVFDYVAGKADWGSAGLPLEGTHDSSTRVGAHLRRDVPTCRLEERLREVQARVTAAGWSTCFVINDEQIILGRLGDSALAREDDVSVEEAMTAGPSTVRPSLELDRTVERMQRQDLTILPVTTSDGKLVGVVELETALRALREQGTS